MTHTAKDLLQKHNRFIACIIFKITPPNRSLGDVFICHNNKRDVSTPAENYEVVVNPQKVGSDSEPS